MSFIAQVTRSLFPKEPPRPARRHGRDRSLLAQVFALGCAMTPLAAMLHAIRETA